jgi:acetyl esterase/lipase
VIALSKPEFREFAYDWTSEAIQHFPHLPQIALQRAEALLLNSQPAEALPLFQHFSEPGNLTHLAALLLCSLAADRPPCVTVAGPEDKLSPEIIAWYRKLLDAGASASVQKLNGQLDRLGEFAPSAARMLGSALSEAAEAA